MEGLQLESDYCRIESATLGDSLSFVTDLLESDYCRIESSFMSNI